jgi:hypothetical protein
MTSTNDEKFWCSLWQYWNHSRTILRVTSDIDTQKWRVFPICFSEPFLGHRGCRSRSAILCFFLNDAPCSKVVLLYFVGWLVGWSFFVEHHLAVRHLQLLVVTNRKAKTVLSNRSPAVSAVHGHPVSDQCSSSKVQAQLVGIRRTGSRITAYSDQHNNAASIPIATAQQERETLLSAWDRGAVSRQLVRAQ